MTMTTMNNYMCDHEGDADDDNDDHDHRDNDDGDDGRQ